MLDLERLLSALWLILQELKNVFSPAVSEGLDLLNYRVSLDDLHAQNHMSYSAWWMVVLTVGQVVISAIGIYLVIETLKDTRTSADAAIKAVEISRHGTIGQLRPWIRIDDQNVILEMRCDPMLDDDDQLRISDFRMSIENRGVSPATDIHAELRFYSQSDSHFALKNLSEAKAGFTIDELAYTVFPGDTQTIEMYLAHDFPEVAHEDWDTTGAVLVLIQYSYAGSDTLFTTRQLFWLSKARCSKVIEDEEGIRVRKEFYTLTPAIEPILT